MNELMTEKQAHAYICNAIHRDVCLKTLTNLRKKLGAYRDEKTGEWFYPSQSVKDNWPEKPMKLVMPKIVKKPNQKNDRTYDYTAAASVLMFLETTGLNYEITFKKGDLK